MRSSVNLEPAAAPRLDVDSIAPMRLLPLEEDRLVIFTAAELARRHRAAGLRLNHPETVALICDAMLEAARGGATFRDVEAAGQAAVKSTEVLDGVRELVDEVRLEVLLDDGMRLVTLVDPLGRDDEPQSDDGPGRTRFDDRPVELTPDREKTELDVRNTSRRRVRVSSHYPFERVNRRLDFDRDRARGFRLDLPAGAWLGWEPGEEKRVGLVRIGRE